MKTCPWCGESEDIQELRRVSPERAFYCIPCSKVFWYDKKTGESVRYQPYENR